MRPFPVAGRPRFSIGVNVGGFAFHYIKGGHRPRPCPPRPRPCVVPPPRPYYGWSCWWGPSYYYGAWYADWYWYPSGYYYYTPVIVSTTTYVNNVEEIENYSYSHISEETGRLMLSVNAARSLTRYTDAATALASARSSTFERFTAHVYLDSLTPTEAAKIEKDVYKTNSYFYKNFTVHFFENTSENSRRFAVCADNAVPRFENGERVLYLNGNVELIGNNAFALGANAKIIYDMASASLMLDAPEKSIRISLNFENEFLLKLIE